LAGAAQNRGAQPCDFDHSPHTLANDSLRFASSARVIAELTSLGHAVQVQSASVLTAGTVSYVHSEAEAQLVAVVSGALDAAELGVPGSGAGLAGAPISMGVAALDLAAPLPLQARSMSALA
jgi:hypothetical protein